MKLLDDLNPQQREAVKHVEGPLLLVAGAGSGKTRVVTYRIAYLLEMGIPASEIVAVTFTNRAASEMRERVERLTKQRILASTFHSLAARILRESIEPLGFRSDFAIFDEEDSEKVLRECMKELNQNEEKGKWRKMKAIISTAKNALLEPHECEEQEEREIYRLYQAKLKQFNALDFDDLLFMTVKLLRDYPEIRARYEQRWSFLLIDEYQDTNRAQGFIVKFLSGTRHNVFAVGDPDQSIYSWRGAEIQNILDFEKEYPGARVLTLEENYRSTTHILQAANALIHHNTSRYEKNLWSSKGEGEKVGLYTAEDEKDEVRFILARLQHHLKGGLKPHECAIFYRTHAQSRVFEDLLLREKISYQIVGGVSFYQRREVKDILAFLRLASGSSDPLSFMRTVNTPKRGIGETTVEKLREAAVQHNVDIIHFLELATTRRVEMGLSQRQVTALSSYVDLIMGLRTQAKSGIALPHLVQAAIDRSRYLDHLKEDPLTFEERKENLSELIGATEEFQAEVPEGTLGIFLEELTLKTNLDNQLVEASSLKLMSLHNSKGLEFRCVFLAGLEEELLPHINSFDSPQALEEERRLCYVGMTRAKEILYMTCSRERWLWGVSRSMRMSRFLGELKMEAVVSYNKETSEAFEERVFDHGEEVFHRTFGKGTIEKSYETSLGLTYDVFFPATGSTKSLVARFAKLIPLS